MTRTMKRIVSVILALVMMVTGLNYTPQAVKADANGTVESDTMTYTIDNIVTTNFDSFEMNYVQSPNVRFAWNPNIGGTQVEVAIQDGQIINTISNGSWISATNFDKLGLAAGEYTMTFTATDAGKENVNATARLTVTSKKKQYNCRRTFSTYRCSII